MNQKGNISGRRLHPLLWIVIISAPFVFWAKTLILPTFDDWTTLSSPNYDPDWLQYFLPYGSSWRPFDAAIGYLYGEIGCRWFPFLSHLLIFAGHLANTVLVYKICGSLQFNRLSQAVATVFFYMSPCVLATVMACDSLNQTYSQLWGLVAVYVYLRAQSDHCRPLAAHLPWLVCVLLATLSKENGLAWAVVPPILAFGFGRIGRKTCASHLALGSLLAVVYAVVRLSLPLTEVYYEEYHSLFSLTGKLKAVFILLSYTWLPGDYIYLLHAPSRNIPLFLLTLLPTLPFVWTLLLRRPRIWLNRQFATLALCALVVVSPNLLITMSMMNAYAWLAMAALIVGFCVHHCDNGRLVLATFVLYLLATTYTYVHHWYCTWQTSLPGREMALQAIEGTGQPVDNVYVLTVEDEGRKYSSFCTLPTEAFGWGRAVWKETGFRWPTVLNDTIVSHDTPQATIDSIARKALNGDVECVWIVRGSSVEVVK